MRCAKLAITIIMVTSLLGIFSPAYPQDYGKRLKLYHNMNVTEHGFIAVDDIVEFWNTQDSFEFLQSFELNYASMSIEDISAVTVQGPVDFDVELRETNGNAKIILVPSSNYEIPSGRSANVSIKFYVSNHVNTTNGVLYSTKMPLVPSMDNIIEEVYSNLILPIDAEISDIPSGFALADDLGVKKLVSIIEKVSPSEPTTEVLFYTKDSASGLFPLEFPGLERRFKVSTDGSVTVRDEIRVINNGQTKVTKILLTLPNDDINMVEIVPISEPPLINRRTITLVDGLLDLSSAYGITLSPNEEFLFGVEYPLLEDYYNYIDGSVSVEVPLKPVVDGVVERYSIKVQSVSGIDISDGEYTVIEDVTPYHTGTFSFHFRLNVVWSSRQVMPLATFLFLAVLISLYLGKSRVMKDEVEKENPYLEEIITIFNQKTSDIDEIIESIKSRRKVGATKNSLLEARRYFESTKGRSAGKLGAAKSRIISARPHLKDKLSVLSNVDKEYNRAVFDIIGLYEKHHLSKMHIDVFEKLLSKYNKRLNKVRERLNEILDYIQSEMEK